MSRKLFGTDGIRGEANSELSPEIALKVGMAAGAYFTRGLHRHRAVIGKDTRLSGYLIEPALTSGFISAGMDVVLVGPLPTPAVAMITRSLRADLGVMISASHNPYKDNGIKLFGPDGIKLTDEVEQQIESLMASDMTKFLAPPDKLGRAKRLDDAQGRYLEYVKSTFPKGKRLDGLKIVVDCANGAAYKLAPTILWELGAEVKALSVSPDGFNINHNCGSTYPDKICKATIKHKADIGISLDGDADRLVISDEKGKLVDGDQIMAAIAGYWNKKGKLDGNGIVATVMSNLGLEIYLKEIGLELERTKVGDKYVIGAMMKKGYNLGGEQSGHIIFNDYTTTGDAMVAALQILALLVESKQKASNVLHVFEPLPQILCNVKIKNSNMSLLDNKLVQKAVKDGQSTLGNSGRILVRKSGTEPVIRIMAEGNDKKLIKKVANSIVDTIAEIQKAG